MFQLQRSCIHAVYVQIVWNVRHMVTQTLLQDCKEKVHYWQGCITS